MVVKQIFVGHMQPDETIDAQSEAKLLQNLKHPNIIRFCDAFAEATFVYIVMEFCEDGDLAQLIAKTKSAGDTFPKKVVINWLIQLAMALFYIHSRRVLHRDLKTNNIFVKRGGVIKLGDFGIARVLHNTMEEASTFAGTPFYMSPECLRGDGYNAKSDIWALGCVVLELCRLEHAFSGKSLIDLMWACPSLPAQPSADDAGCHKVQNLRRRRAGSARRVRPRAGRPRPPAAREAPRRPAHGTRGAAAAVYCDGDCRV